jgi:hypothetical protein
MAPRLDRFLDIGYEDRMLGASLPEPATVLRWLVAKQQSLEAGAPLALLRGGEQEFVIRTRFPCVVDGLVIEPEERLLKGMVLLRVQTDRQNEPQGRHYCDIAPVE